MKVLDASLIYLKKGIKIDQRSMHVDLTTSFSRLVVILEWFDIMSHGFQVLTYTILYFAIPTLSNKENLLTNKKIHNL